MLLHIFIYYVEQYVIWTQLELDMFFIWLFVCAYFGNKEDKTKQNKTREDVQHDHDDDDDEEKVKRAVIENCFMWTRII